MTTKPYDATSGPDGRCAFIESLSDDEVEALFTVGDPDEELSEHVATCAVCAPRVEQVLTRETTLNEVAAFERMVNRALDVVSAEPPRQCSRLRLVTKRVQPSAGPGAEPVSLKIAAENTAADWPVSIDAELENGEHVQLAFRPAGFGLAVTLDAGSPDPIVITASRLNGEIRLAPGATAAFGSLFDAKLTAASSPEELLRQLDAADLSIRKE